MIACVHGRMNAALGLHVYDKDSDAKKLRKNVVHYVQIYRKRHKTGSGSKMTARVRIDSENFLAAVKSECVARPAATQSTAEHITPENTCNLDMLCLW